MREFLRNAFALDDGKPCAPSDDERAILERVVDEVVRRRLAAPALAFLEMSRPLNVVGAAVVHFFTPIAAVLTNPVQLRRFADFLERRGSVDYLCRMIERAEETRRNGCCEGSEPLDGQDPARRSAVPPQTDAASSESAGSDSSDTNSSGNKRAGPERVAVGNAGPRDGGNGDGGLGDGGLGDGGLGDGGHESAGPHPAPHSVAVRRPEQQPSVGSGSGSSRTDSTPRPTERD